MTTTTASSTVGGPIEGVNQNRVRDYNERLILSILQRFGPHPGSEIARMTGLSPQTVSVILRALEADGLLERGAPQRGRVGKPSVPMGLAADGAFAFGLKIGRRSADLVLCDLTGAVRASCQTTYRYPMPDPLLDFARDGVATLLGRLPSPVRHRVAGIGMAKPFEIWNWEDTIGAPPTALSIWRSIDLAARIEAATGQSVVDANDATAACRAELLHGTGRRYRSFAYLFVGSFIGGGVVLDQSVVEGNHGNAGAFGSIPSRLPNGEDAQLIDTASLHLLEAALERAGHDPMTLWRDPQVWTGFDGLLDAWIEQSSQAIARAALTLCAVIDFDAVLIDGAFPVDVRARLVAGTDRALDRLDMRGVVRPVIREGIIGGNARAIGAACAPIQSHYMLGQALSAAFG